jgi:uncharacterized protein YeaO (DUF488 family)
MRRVVKKGAAKKGTAKKGAAKKGAAKKGAAKSKAAKSKAAKSKARKTHASIRIKRAYDPPGADDGLRILIDRLWPRGLAKSKLKLDAWPKHLSPSNALRKWYRHDPEKFAEFRERYVAELEAQGDGLDKLRAAVKGQPVTLLTATKEIDLSHATVLRDLLG